MSEMEQGTFDAEIEDQFTPEPEAEPQPETYRVGDREFTPDQLEPVLQFVDWANENPEGWRQLQEWEEGKAQFVPIDEFPAPQVAEPIQEPEQDLWSEDYLRDLGQRTADLQAELERRTYTEAAGAVEEGINAFLSQHKDLSETEVNAVLDWVTDRQALASIPDDLPFQRKAGAIADRLDEAYKVVYYDRAQADGEKGVIRDLNKRRRASSSTSSASAPRVAPAPTNRQERHQAFVNEIAEALENNS